MACLEDSEDTDSRSGEETCTRFLFEGSEPGLTADFLAGDSGWIDAVLALDELLGYLGSFDGHGWGNLLFHSRCKGDDVWSCRRGWLTHLETSIGLVMTNKVGSKGGGFGSGGGHR